VAGPPPKQVDAFRVLHSADWHLGKTMGDLDRTEEHSHFLEFLLETIRATETDALVIAGDVFDSATPPQSAVRLYFEFLARLHAQGGCQVVVTAGNHDSPSHLEAPRNLLRVVNTRVVAVWPDDVTATLEPLPSAESPKLLVAAVPFLRERDLRTGYLGQSAAEIQRDLREGLMRRYSEIAQAAQPWLERGVPVLVTGHLAALGGTACDSEREIHVGGLGAIGADAFSPAFAYVALGHLHRAQAVGGQAHIRYSGSPITLSFSEAADRKELRMLDFASGKLVGNTSIAIPQPRHLVQLRLPHAELENRLRAFSPPASVLTPWVEVIVQDVTGSEDLYRVVQDAVAQRPFQVVRVFAERTGASAALGLDENALDEDAGELLADPKSVFKRRLDEEPLSDPEKAVLLTAFDELCSLLDDRRVL
jgi:exonuclease SbcD